MQTKGHDCKLKLVLRILYVYCLLLRGSCHEPLQRSRVVKKLAAPIFSSRSSMLEIRYTSNSKMAFSFLKSMHIRSEPSFLDTTKSVFHHLELECLMTLSSTILITAASLPALICVVLFVPFYNHTLHTQTHTHNSSSYSLLVWLFLPSLSILKVKPVLHPLLFVTVLSQS